MTELLDYLERFELKNELDLSDSNPNNFDHI